ncbi:response regulator transcription factor [Cohnella thailandensis]|uniref:Response regulator transcription factor n=1 Tax=Cohnella thailandensis TaxID=557557 RepID=A0A841SRJ4_9BACL|nr:response regulator transcription factor [Cohnella thailandensis]MBB6632520.1 response regulator transcription factor [Cohnella thailandensis]MBP1971812.1 two-component system vancomycin resistance associated response regulator VraR [Cohnella thailandensis]
MERIRVWIVEDDRDWLRGLKAYLDRQPDMEVVYSFGVAEEVRGTLLAGGLGADVILMDIMLDGVPEGIRLAEEAALATGARVIMLTSMEEKELILRSFQAGAIDYRIKSDFDALPEAVRAAASRQSPISPEAAERMREEFRRLKRLEREFEAKKLRELITPSELELLELIDEGYSQSQIAEKRFLSLRTVKNHVGNILRKLRTESSKDAARQAKEMGLFERTGEGENKKG